MRYLPSDLTEIYSTNDAIYQQSSFMEEKEKID